ncbi:Peptidase M28 family protein [Quillaja saponaria]|uniref:glutamate carboxypeptidase II n=1 Tax=Quillaja saponaria TaxID=32244 RepID=A0AAD7VHR0_QUISA|nr:Peptidase M28 family protein [Quillaja saponaria]
MFQFLSKPATIFTAKSRPLGTFVFIVILCFLGLYTLHFPLSFVPTSNSRNASRFQHLFLSSASNFTISSYLRILTQHPHLAGTKLASDTTRYVLNHFKDLGLETRTVNYKTLLSYPVYASLSAHFSDGSFLDLPLTEMGGSEQVGQDVVPPYHAYSPSGSAHAKAVFINYGLEEDYLALGLLGVNVSGCIVIARKGVLTRGAVIQRAEGNGALAVLLYAEGERFRNGFERGTVMTGIGDPLSPGWAGVDGGDSLELEDSEVLKRFPKIPSMPLSVETAETILDLLAGVPVPQEWRDTLRSRVKGVGPGPAVLNFTYQGEKKVVTIQNVLAIIRGMEEPDRYVLLGNHRDAWTYGAVDPNSGTAALLDIARRYSLLLRFGWNPQRTIILCSWDAEEFGMIGSTEWVEQNLVNLGSKVVAYLNVDCAVQGPGFFAGATPQLDNLLLEVTKKVKDPDSEDATLYDKWAATAGNSNIERLSGVNSDFAPFVHRAGIPSIDIYYGRDFPVYHTAFDSYKWMTEYGDPLFWRHVAVTGVWGLLALRLADDSVLPFNYHSCVDQLQGYESFLSNLFSGTVSLHPLTTSIRELASAAKEADDELKKLRFHEAAGDFIELKKRALNDRLLLAEKGFLDADGLPGRPWFKHLVYGPPADCESNLVFFPGIADAISQSTAMSKKEGRAAIQHEIWRVARAIQRAAYALRGELT